MNVGLLTYHWVSNFGANLQALSTYKYLENHGYTPVVLNWVPERLEKYYIDIVPACQVKAHNDFKNKHFVNITPVCRDEKAIAKAIDDYSIDIVVIGSDAVFSTKPLLSRIHFGRKGLTLLKPCEDALMPNPFWGSFLPYVKRPIKVVAISASAQNSPFKKAWFSSEKKEYERALDRFSLLTVRDIWTQRMVAYFTKNRIIPNVAPDPVFGFEQNVNPGRHFYVSKTLGITAPYVLLSVSSTMSREWQKEIEDIFLQNGILTVGMPRTTKTFDPILKYNLSFPIDPLDWYDAIKCSKGYVGELMHPVLVSLHNSVPVYIFDTYGFKRRGTLDKSSSKTFQITKRFGLLSNNYYNKLLSKMPPSPQEVVNAVVRFDSTHEKEIASVMMSEYNSAMKAILSV
jgi:hypothetical protein